MDQDVRHALESRDKIANELPSKLEVSRQVKLLPDALRALKLMRGNTVYVWEPNALESCNVFWNKRENHDRIEEDCLSNGHPRFIKGLLDHAYHFFPAGGPILQQTVPSTEAGSVSELMFPPTVTAIGTRIYDHDEGPQVAAVIETRFLDAARLPSDHFGRRRLAREIATTPPRKILFGPLISAFQAARIPYVVNGVLADNNYPIDWVLAVYKLRLFVEQPFVGRRRDHPTKRDVRKYGLHPAEEVLTVYMREALDMRIPTFRIPGISFVTGHRLEFEVDVKEHRRVCASGVVTTVRAHTRGPKGVRREHVIKVIR